MTDPKDAMPQGWIATQLGEVALISSGYGFPHRLQGRQDQVIPFAKVRDISRSVAIDGRLSRADHTISTEDLRQLRAATLPEGTIVFAKIGEAIRLNRRAITTKALVVDNNVMAVSPADGQVDPQFLFRWSQTIDLYPLAGATTVPSIRKSVVSALQFPLPPRNEQRRIVTKIEALQARSDAAKKALDAIPPLLEKFRQSVLAAAFRGDLTKAWREAHPDVEPASVLLERIRAERRRRWEEAKPGKKYKEPEPVDTKGLPELPKGWCWASLEEVSSATRTICYGVVQPGEDQLGGVPLVRICDIDDGVIDTKNIRTIPREVATEYERSRLEGGEVLITVVGTIGRTCIVSPSLNGANIARAIARIVPSETINGAWILFALRSPRLQDTLARGSREVARKTLNISTLARVAIPLASQQETNIVIKQLRRLLAFEKKTAIQTSKSTEPLACLTQSILAKAFRGDLVPQDPNDEPAAVLLERIRAERAAAEAANPRKRARKAKATKRPRAAKK